MRRCVSDCAQPAVNVSIFCKDAARAQKSSFFQFDRATPIMYGYVSLTVHHDARTARYTMMRFLCVGLAGFARCSAERKIAFPAALLMLATLIRPRLCDEIMY